MYIGIIVGLGVLGAVFGSFAMAQVWRLRARQLVEDKQAKRGYDTAELKRLHPLIANVSRDRSQCLKCRRRLQWYDLLPVVSWLMLGGRCRYCYAAIGVTELVVEVVLAGLFIASFLYWPAPLVSGIEVSKFMIWLGSLVALVVLFVYDMRWFLLPNFVNWAMIGMAGGFAGLSLVQATDITASLWSFAGSVAVLSGLYLMLYVVSRGAWVGFGDVKLGLGLALLLGTWQLAFVALFVANLVGTLLVLPGIFMGRITRTTKVPFGPLLIIGFLIAWFFGSEIIRTYASFI